MPQTLASETYMSLMCPFPQAVEVKGRVRAVALVATSVLVGRAILSMGIGRTQEKGTGEGQVRP